MSDFLSELDKIIEAPMPKKGAAYIRHQKQVAREAKALAKKVIKNEGREIEWRERARAEKKLNRLKKGMRTKAVDKLDDLTRAQFESLTPKQQEELIEAARFTPKQLKIMKKKKAFLLHFRAMGNETKAARKAGFKYGKAAIDRMRKKDPLFDLNCRIAQQEAIAELEIEARRRAIHGTEEYVTYRGEVSYLRDAAGELIIDPITGEAIPIKVRKYSDRLLELLLKRFDPAYRDKEPAAPPAGGGVLLIQNNTTNNNVTWEQQAEQHEKSMGEAREKLKHLLPDSSGLPVIDLLPAPDKKEPQKITTGHTHV